MDEMSVHMYDTVCTEEPEDCIEHDEFSETLPPCKECERNFFYRKSTFNVFDGLFVLISMGTLVADIVTDTLVTVLYFKSDNPQYACGSLTLAFTLGPSIVMQIFSASWYIADEDMTNWRWLIHLIQLAPLQRYIRVFRTGLEARKSDDPLDFQRLHHQQSDMSMLRLFEAFLESAPQVVLQLYIIVTMSYKNDFIGISAMVSLFSLCWAMVAYSKNHRKVRNDKNIMSIPGLILQTIWRIGMISSRVVALVLFASVLEEYLYVVAIHWFCMTIWVYLQNTDFCDNWVEERIFNAVIGVIYIFCFFNLKEGNSRYRVTIFYAIMFAENVVLVYLWYNNFKGEGSLRVLVGFSVVVGGFAIGVSSMLLYYRFFHPRGSGAILLFKKKKAEDENRLRRDDRRRPRISDGAEIIRRSRTPTPKTSPHKRPSSSPMAYPIPSRSLTPCKYSPLKSEGKLPYDRYGMRRQQRSQSEACIDVFGNSTVTPAPRMGRVHSEHLYSQNQSAMSNVGFEFSGFATDLVKQFDKKMDQACASAMNNCSYGSYGFDVEAQQRQLQDDRSTANLEHTVMVHAAASQPDMRRAVTSVNERDQSSVLLEPMPNTIDSPSKIKSAYEVRQIYHEMLEEERPKRSSKRQLMFGQSSTSPSPIKNRTPSPMCAHHQQLSAQRASTLPLTKQKAWPISEIKSQPQHGQKIKKPNRGPPPKVPLRADLTQNREMLNRLKIPHDTSKAERAMLKCGEKRKFSFREKVPPASLKAMRFTPKTAPVTDPSSPIWKLRDLNARLWQPKTVDIYNPKLNQSPGKPKLVAQKRFDSKSNANNQAKQVNHEFSFNSDSSNKSGNFYSIFGPSNQIKTTDEKKSSVSSAAGINNGKTPSSNQRVLTNTRTTTGMRTHPFGVTINPQSLPNNFNLNKTENIYTTIDEDESVRDDYSELRAQMTNTSQSHSNFCGSGGSQGSGGGSGGKKRKLSPRADLPQLELKPSQQSAHPVTPLTPSKSYRLADCDLLNSPHRHLTSSSDRLKSRLDMASNKKESVDTCTPLQGNKTETQIVTSSENRLSTREVNVFTDTKKPISKPGPKQSVLSSIVLPAAGSSQSTQQKISETKPGERHVPLLNRTDGKENIFTQQQQRCATKSEPPNILKGGKDTKTRSPIEKQSALSSSMPTITNSQSRKSSLNSRNDVVNPKVSQTHKNNDVIRKSQASLEKQSVKSQSLPEIASSKDTSQMKKGMKPKAHSDTRGNCIKPVQTSIVRKPLGELQNGSTTSMLKLASTSNKTSSNERLESKPPRSYDLSDKTNVSHKPKRSSPAEKLFPLMQSTPALPDCRKLLRFESTGAKPKVRQPDTDIKSSNKTKKKPLSPVENNSDENQSTPASSCTSRGEVTSTNLNSGAPTAESRLRDRIGRYDPDILRSGKENQHLAIAKMFDILSPTDSFISSLAFQNTFDKRIPPKKPPRMSLSKIPSNTVSDNVAKFSNGTDL